MRTRRTRHRSQEEGLRLVGYVRVSTEDQATNGVSPEAQRDRLHAHAKALGYQLVAIEDDNGVSGGVPPKKRAGLSRALALIASGQADGIVFLKLDRLSRSVRDILQLADDAKRKGWHLVSVHEHIDTASAHGKFTLGVLALLAEMEREQIGERTKFGMDQIARQGRARSSRLPFGFRVEGSPESTTLRAGDHRRLVEHAEEQELLRMMLAHRNAGLGAHRIAKEMNLVGPNPRTGRPWTTSTIAAILRTAHRRALLAA